MSLDRLQSKTGRLELAPENTSVGFPGGIGLGPNAGVVEGAAASRGGALYSTPQPKSGTVPDLVTGGTITHNGNGVMIFNPGAASTGNIVQAGTVHGQQLTIVNIASGAGFTITMAAAGASNVANGTSCVVSLLAAIQLVWNALDSRWYQVRAA